MLKTSENSMFLLINPKYIIDNLRSERIATQEANLELMDEQRDGLVTVFSKIGQKLAIPLII